MPLTTRILRQWLATDAAFGVLEVPLPRRKAPAKPAPGQPPVRPAATDHVRSVVREAYSKAPPSPPPPPARQAVPPPAPARPAALPRKSTSAMPAEALTPPGLIAELPPITRQHQEAQLAKLLAHAQAAAKPWLSDIATQLVFGEGDPDAPLFFVGEGPGADEDRLGRPFVGRSGQLLDKMIAAMGLKRERIYIGNIVKLRAADPDPFNPERLKDRPPTIEEAARGLPILHQQIAIVRPKVIVTLGASALRFLTNSVQPITKIRGNWLAYRGVPLMPTYHPSFVLRNYTTENRAKVWNDLKLALAKIQPPPS